MMAKLILTKDVEVARRTPFEDVEESVRQLFYNMGAASVRVDEYRGTYRTELYSGDLRQRTRFDTIRGLADLLGWVGDSV